MERHPLLAAVYSCCIMLNEGQGFLDKDTDSAVQFWMDKSRFFLDTKKKSGMELTHEDVQSVFFIDIVTVYRILFKGESPAGAIDYCLKVLEKIPKKERWFKSAFTIILVSTTWN